MPVPKTNRIHSLFDDDPTVPDPPNESLGGELPSVKIALLIGALLLGAAIVWSVHSTSGIAAEQEIQLVGARAGQLQPGAPVVVGGVRIGSVFDLTYEDRQAVATLRVDPNVAAQLTSDTRFYVKSLSSSGQSNIGVEAVVGNRFGEALPLRIEITEEPTLRDWVRDQLPSSWSDGETTERLNEPASWNWLIIAVSITVIVMLAAVSVRLLRSLLPVAIFAAVVVAIVYLLMQQGLLPSDWQLPSLTEMKQSLVSD
jgi:hypothetical protein